MTQLTNRQSDEQAIARAIAAANQRSIETLLLLAALAYVAVGAPGAPQPVQDAIARARQSVTARAAQQGDGEIDRETLRLAIGEAEGNYRNGQPTELLDGHSDPGNGKANQGWCSDQGRGGGNLARANEACDRYVFDKIPEVKQALRAAGFEPRQHPELFANTLDLWNQAGPPEWERLPIEYAKDRNMARARVRTFGGDGSTATGLTKHCPELGTFDCVLRDQRRRVEAIASVLSKRSLFADSAKTGSEWACPVPKSGVSFTSGYRIPSRPQHNGIDLAAAIGTPIYAAKAGRVTVARGGYNDGYGNLVQLAHPDGSFTRYAHNSQIKVQPGQQVGQGELIALMGNTGFSTGPHLHFEIHPSGEADKVLAKHQEQPIDPLPLVGEVCGLGEG